MFSSSKTTRTPPEPGLLIGQVIKCYSGRWVVDVTRRVARGNAEAIAAVLARTGTGINTAYIERLNATFRRRCTPLVRRGRALVRERCVEADVAEPGAGDGGRSDGPPLGIAGGVGVRLPPERWKAPRRKRRRRTATPVTPRLAA